MNVQQHEMDFNLQGHSYQKEITELGIIDIMNKLVNKSNEFVNYPK